jgi:hypothetical protein
VCRSRHLHWLLSLEGHVWFPVTVQLKKSLLCSLYCVRKVNILAFRFILCSSINIFGTQHKHNFQRGSLSDKISWRNDHEFCGKCREIDKMVNRLFYWIFINHRLLATPRIIMQIFMSFIKVSHLSPYHWITHGMFSIHLTKLMMNVSRFHVSCIQGMDYRKHFTCGRLLSFLEHCKHAGQRVNMVQLSANGVCAFPNDQQILHTCTIVTVSL